MRQLILGTMAAATLMLGLSTASFAAPMSHSPQPVRAESGFHRVDYYWNHHHYHHRDWDRHHHRWHYY